MVVRWRPLVAKDVRPCVEIVASHPVTGPRYRSAIADLGKAWLRILGSEAAGLIVYEEMNGSRATLCGVGAAVFARDKFLRELKARPFWVGPELAKRIVHGDSPVLSDREVREANSSTGLTVLAWEGAVKPEFEGDTEVRRILATSFIENFRGFRLNEIFAAQSGVEPRLEWLLETGGLLWDPATGQYMERFEGDAKEVIRKPYVVGLTRELERHRPGTWIGALFEYTPPRCGFSKTEQQLLFAALNGEGGTDQELAAALRVSLPTVKKIWMSIYDRASSCLPELMGTNSRTDHDSVQRGKEKRRHLLGYLRDHHEELRPVSRKTLMQNNSGQKADALHGL